MTRINVVPVATLTRQHLVAEYRELPRVFRLVLHAQVRGMRWNDPKIQGRYTLGRGHVTFFYNKLGWCLARFEALVREMKTRGYQPRYLSIDPAILRQLDAHWFGDWTPTRAAIRLNRDRIRERLQTSIAPAQVKHSPASG
jgi:deoxyribonuclease (pyrimidine dimer)